MSEVANRALAEALFAALEAMDWPAAAELFTDDGVYQDMPFAPLGLTALGQTAGACHCSLEAGAHLFEDSGGVDGGHAALFTRGVGDRFDGVGVGEGAVSLIDLP